LTRRPPSACTALFANAAERDTLSRQTNNRQLTSTALRQTRVGLREMCVSCGSRDRRGDGSERGAAGNPRHSPPHEGEQERGRTVAPSGL
jgi:hypothetical protein